MSATKKRRYATMTHIGKHLQYASQIWEKIWRALYDPYRPLVRTKLVTEHYERVMQGGRPINVTRMRITAAGRLALKPLR